MRETVFLTAVLVLCSLASAASVSVVDPIRVEILAEEALLEDKSIDLGVVGPGQKLELVAQVATGEISRGNETVSQNEADWDQLEVVDESLPSAWKGRDSLRFETPMKALVVVDKAADDGEYAFLLRTRDDFEGVNPITFKAKARVASDVLEMRIAGEPVKVEPAAQTVYQLELFNKGSANDVFEIAVEGLPKENEARQTAFAPHNSKVVVNFALTAPEAREYRLAFTATSLSSPRITSRATTTLFVGSTLFTDLKAAARGVLLFPGAEQLIYSILALVGSLVR